MSEEGKGALPLALFFSAHSFEHSPRSVSLSDVVGPFLPSFLPSYSSGHFLGRIHLTDAEGGGSQGYTDLKVYMCEVV